MKKYKKTKLIDYQNSFTAYHIIGKYEYLNYKWAVNFGLGGELVVVLTTLWSRSQLGRFKYVSNDQLQTKLSELSESKQIIKF